MKPSVNTDDFVKSAFKHGHSAMYLSGMSNQAVSDGGQRDGGGVAFFSSLPLGILHGGAVAVEDLFSALHRHIEAASSPGKVNRRTASLLLLSPLRDSGATRH
jgi:hypothetical protein